MSRYVTLFISFSSHAHQYVTHASYLIKLILNYFFTLKYIYKIHHIRDNGNSLLSFPKHEVTLFCVLRALYIYICIMHRNCFMYYVNYIYSRSASTMFYILYILYIHTCSLQTFFYGTIYIIYTRRTGPFGPPPDMLTLFN